MHDFVSICVFGLVGRGGYIKYVDYPLLGPRSDSMQSTLM